MEQGRYYLVLDIGTSGIKALVFDDQLNVVVRAHQPLKRYFPKKGWVEQEPEELLSASKKALQEAVQKSQLPKTAFAGMGITNQRETTILWDKKTGKPVYRAIVWEDIRTAKSCQKLQKKFGRLAAQKAGLYYDPYFSASKIWWILKNIPEAKEVLERKDLLFGTVDTWVLWNFCKGQPHVTDYTNASRTLLMDIKRIYWDSELLEVFKIPRGILPSLNSSQSFFGLLEKDILGFYLPVLAVCGDQQASLYAVGTKDGTTKVTYGTGAFMMQVLGSEFQFKKPFFTTLTPGPEPEKPVYAFEGKINACGAQVAALLDKNEPEKLLALLKKFAQSVDAYVKKLPLKPETLVIDGGVARNEHMASIQAEVSGVKVEKQKIFDGTALGVAKLLNHPKTLTFIPQNFNTEL